MPTDDRQIIVTGQASAPAQWVIPGNGQITPRAVFAHYDGTGAATPYVPALKVVSDGGKTVGIFPTAPSVAAGGSADVSWFPGLNGPVSSSKLAVVGARIENHAGQTISSATDTDLTYDTVAFDTGSMANLAGNNKILTANSAGLYLITWERSWPYNNAGRRLVGVLHNQLISTGGTYVADDSRPAVWAANIGAGGQTTNPGATLIKCAAGDTIASGCNQDSGSSLTFAGGPGDYLAAILLGNV